MAHRAVILVALLVALLPFASNAQTLPQSTLDRQEIAQLQQQLAQPGLSEIDRLQIEQRITELQYRISTRPPIAPQPTLAPFAPGHPLPRAVLPPLPLMLGSPAPPASHCETLRILVTYLTSLQRDPQISPAERNYTAERIAALRREQQADRCP